MKKGKISGTVNAKEFIEDPAKGVLVQILLELPHVHVVAPYAVLQNTNLIETLKPSPAQNFLCIICFTLFLNS